MVQHPDQPVPWHADLIAADGLAGAVALLSACHLARDVSRHSVILALAALTHGNLSARRLTPPTAPAIPEADWHRLPAADVLSHLGSGPQGLTAAEAGTRRSPAAAEPTPLQRLASHFGNELLNPLTPVLAIGAGLSLAVGSVLDAAMVASVVLADAGIGAVQQLRAERAIAALDRTATQQVRVRRDGADQVVPAADLVVGDVVYLAAGAGIPADCRLVDADSLETDESSLTGESLPVAKTPAPSDAVALAERTCMLYAGTAVAAGQGTAVVVATGADTAAGRAADGARAPRTGVEARLESLAAGPRRSPSAPAPPSSPPTSPGAVPCLRRWPRA